MPLGSIPGTTHKKSLNESIPLISMAFLPPPHLVGQKIWSALSLWSFFFIQYWGLNPGAFYLRATPLALFFILYFETGSH